MRRRGLESWHRNNNADARAIVRRVVQAVARRGHDPLIDPIAERLAAIRLDPFGNGSTPRRSREVTRTLLWEAHHLTRSWRTRESRCGLCGEVGPLRPCRKGFA